MAIKAKAGARKKKVSAVGKKKRVAKKRIVASAAKAVRKKVVRKKAAARKKVSAVRKKAAVRKKVSVVRKKAVVRKKVSAARKKAPVARKKVVVRKKAAVRKKRRVVVTSPAIEKLNARVVVAEERLLKSKAARVAAREKVRVAVINDRRGKSGRTRLALERARAGALKAKNRVTELTGKLNAARAGVREQVRQEKGVLKRGADLAAAVERFSRRFLRDYDKKLAKRAKALARKKRTVKKKRVVRKKRAA